MEILFQVLFNMYCRFFLNWGFETNQDGCLYSLAVKKSDPDLRSRGSDPCKVMQILPDPDSYHCLTKEVRALGSASLLLAVREEFCKDGCAMRIPGVALPRSWPLRNTGTLRQNRGTRNAKAFQERVHPSLEFCVIPGG